MNLRDYLLNLNISQGDFAKILGVTTSYLNSVIRGKKKPGLNLVQKITEITSGKVNGLDLLNGEGVHKGETKKCKVMSSVLRKKLKEINK